MIRRPPQTDHADRADRVARLRGPTALALGAVLLCGLLLAPRAARAQDGGVGGSLTQNDFFIGVQRDNGVNLTTFELERFFNKANCDCNTPVFLFVTLTQSGFNKRLTVPSGNIDFWIGSDCSTATTRALGKCALIKSEIITTFLQQGKETLETNARIISTNTALTTISPDGGVTNTPTVGAFTPTPNCTSTSPKFAQTIWALLDYGADGVYDLPVTKSVNVRLTPPPPPTEVRLQPGNEALVASWNVVNSVTNPDLQGYQILCRRGANLQVFPTGTFTPAFQTCSATNLPGDILGLDPLFVCSPLLTRSTTSFRVQILQNDIPYAVGVTSLDISGNASIPVIRFDRPIKTSSFYDIYRDPFEGNTTQMEAPGKDTGGFCAVGAGGVRAGRAAALSLLGAAGAAALVIARRRRRRRRGP